jgi:uncharacterized Fe-S cluster-containing MiaB family protein
MFKEHVCRSEDCYTEYVIYQPEKLWSVEEILKDIKELDIKLEKLDAGLIL